MCLARRRKLRADSEFEHPSKIRKCFQHFKDLGFTNRLALYILGFLAIGLSGGFVLAWRSISCGYTGALACWSVCFTPIGTATSVVLSKIVQKSTVENLGANGEGVKYAAAKANGFNKQEHWESPRI